MNLNNDIEVGNRIPLPFPLPLTPSLEACHVLRLKPVTYHQDIQPLTWVFTLHDFLHSNPIYITSKYGYYIVTIFITTKYSSLVTTFEYRAYYSTQPSICLSCLWLQGTLYLTQFVQINEKLAILINRESEVEQTQSRLMQQVSDIIIILLFCVRNLFILRLWSNTQRQEGRICLCSLIGNKTVPQSIPSISCLLGQK